MVSLHPALHLHGVFLPDEIERDAWIVAGVLTFEKPVGEATTISGRGWVLPGFVDAHSHIGYAPEGFLSEPEKLFAQARLHRDAGALLIRDAGSPVDNRIVQEQDDLPRLIRGGRHIAAPKRYIRDLGVEVSAENLVDEVATQALAGDGWVKLVGDWIDRSVGDLAPLWPDDVLEAAIDKAHELGARVTAHVFGEDALPGLFNAGIDCVEHGTGLDADNLDLALANGVAVVPTLINIDNFPTFAREGDAKFPIYAAHMRSLFATSRDRVRAAYEAGLPIYTGTDAGGTLPHGLIRDEIRALMGAGIPLAEVIAIASWKGRAWLGLPGLVEGAFADLVVYADDPRTTQATLYSPKRIVLRGAVVS
ncbi:MAG TPA: amidohydrolase family protein [Jatrophihabitans sp.]|jgi:imidazolonepropionase-like amidohydrolase